MFILLFASGLSYGQIHLKKSNLSSAGGSTENGTTHIIYSVGEVAVQENTQGNTHLSEGFIGPDIITAVGIEDYTELTGIFTYPNPVETFLNIELPENKDYEIYLYNLNGQQLLKTKTSGLKNKQLNLSAYPSTIYMLIIIDRKMKKTKIIKIEKS